MFQEVALFKVISSCILSTLYMLSQGSFWLKVLLWQDSGKMYGISLSYWEKTLHFYSNLI